MPPLTNWLTIAYGPSWVPGGQGHGRGRVYRGKRTRCDCSRSPSRKPFLTSRRRAGRVPRGAAPREGSGRPCTLGGRDGAGPLRHQTVRRRQPRRGGCGRSQTFQCGEWLTPGSLQACSVLFLQGEWALGGCGGSARGTCVAAPASTNSRAVTAPTTRLPASSSRRAKQRSPTHTGSLAPTTLDQTLGTGSGAWHNTALLSHCRHPLGHVRSVSNVGANRSLLARRVGELRLKFILGAAGVPRGWSQRPHLVDRKPMTDAAGATEDRK